jgi:hypothetical protein
VATVGRSAAAQAEVRADAPAIALLEPADVSLLGVPVDRIAAALVKALDAHGLRVLPAAETEALLRKYRERYTGGVAGALAGAFGSEAGAQGILVTEVDDWEELGTARVALTARLVGATADAPILWIDAAAHHALERPGAFGVGLGKDADELLAIAADELAASLARERGIEPDAERRPPRVKSVEHRFVPRTLAVTPPQGDSAVPAGRLRVAVLPFFTDGPDRGLGELFALQFVRHLVEVPGYDVLEPGVVRQALLDARVIQEEGVSLPQVDAVRALLNVDVVVSGRVTQYDPLGLSPGSPASGFSARAIDARTRRVVWASFSYAEGDDGLRWFETKWVRSGVLLTSELVRGIMYRLDQDLPKAKKGHP